MTFIIICISTLPRYLLIPLGWGGGDGFVLGGGAPGVVVPGVVVPGVVVPREVVLEPKKSLQKQRYLTNC